MGKKQEVTKHMDTRINYSRLPEHIRAEMKRYIENRVPPGDFLMAVLSNSLVESFGRADFNNRKRMFDIAGFLYNEAPARCWGSPEKVARWLQCER